MAAERNVAAVIREAIDVRFSDDGQRRAQAARDFLAMPDTRPGGEPDWAETKAAMEQDLIDRAATW